MKELWTRFLKWRQQLAVEAKERRRKLRETLKGQAWDWAEVHYPGELKPLAALTAEILVEQSGITYEQFFPAMRFIDDIQLDDLDAVEFVMAIEEEFGIKVSDADALTLSTFDDLIRYLRDRVPDPVPAPGQSPA